MVRDNISSTKWYWDLDPWRTDYHQLRLRVENGRWTDITLRDGDVLGRDDNGMRLPDEYPELYNEFTFSMLNSEYLATAEGVQYVSGDGPEPEEAFAPPSTREIAISHGAISDQKIVHIRKWWNRGVAIIAIAAAILLFKDAPWSDFLDWYMQTIGKGMSPP